MNFILIATLLIFGAVCQARHIHPGNYDPQYEEVIFEEINNENPKNIQIDVFRHLKPSRLVPLNNDVFFKSIEPCEDGFQRDVLGICREVWD